MLMFPGCPLTSQILLVVTNLTGSQACAPTGGGRPGSSNDGADHTVNSRFRKVEHPAPSLPGAILGEDGDMTTGAARDVLGALARLHQLAVSQAQERAELMREAAIIGASAEQIALVLGDPLDEVRGIVGHSAEGAVSTTAAFWS